MVRGNAVRTAGSVLAALVIAAALAFALTGPGPSGVGNGVEIDPKKPHCKPHGVVPVFVRPGCD